ncbi:hypothetical protein BJX63DRAFT_3755 [Aspergillus granulosus]|uniref:Uncharacterized protein n=1 Tax=Aspergillus granulosus TaxID=176169 RepID=A0ABR4I5J6_9EURO
MRMRGWRSNTERISGDSIWSRTSCSTRAWQNPPTNPIKVNAFLPSVYTFPPQQTPEVRPSCPLVLCPPPHAGYFLWENAPAIDLTSLGVVVWTLIVIYRTLFHRRSPLPAMC